MVLEICYSVGPKSKDSKRNLCTRIVPARPESRATTANERIDVVGNGGEGGCRRTQHQHQQEREHVFCKKVVPQQRLGTKRTFGPL